MKNTKFSWKCVCCEKQHIEIFKFQFDMSSETGHYTCETACDKCGKKMLLTFKFGVERLLRVKNG